MISLPHSVTLSLEQVVGQLLQSLLFQVKARDPITIGVVALVLWAVEPPRHARGSGGRTAP
jgi:hypothetical protein